MPATPTAMPRSTEPAALGFHPDDITPIPRPSSYHGREQDAQMRAAAEQVNVPTSRQTRSIVPAAPDLFPAKIDKSGSQLRSPNGCATRRT